MDTAVIPPEPSIEQAQDDGENKKSVEGEAAKKDDECLDITYEAVFKQPKSTQLEKTPNEIVKKVYDSARKICYYGLVFVVTMPIVGIIGLGNASMIWMYSWLLLPMFKMCIIIEKMMIAPIELIVKTACEPIAKLICRKKKTTAKTTAEVDKTANVDIVAKIQTV